MYGPEVSCGQRYGAAAVIASAWTNFAKKTMKKGKPGELVAICGNCKSRPGGFLQTKPAAKREKATPVCLIRRKAYNDSKEEKEGDYDEQHRSTTGSSDQRYGLTNAWGLLSWRAMRQKRVGHSPISL